MFCTGVVVVNQWSIGKDSVCKAGSKKQCHQSQVHLFGTLCWYWLCWRRASAVCVVGAASLVFFVVLGVQEVLNVTACHFVGVFAVQDHFALLSLIKNDQL